MWETPFRSIFAQKMVTNNGFKEVSQRLVFLCFSGIYFGTNGGWWCMAAIQIGLEILQNSVVEKDRESATKVAEIRKDGNLLLVTLLLTNTLAMEFLPLVMDTIFPGGLFSLILSVLLVMLFGEVIPQVCLSPSRQKLFMRQSCQ